LTGRRERLEISAAFCPVKITSDLDDDQFPALYDDSNTPKAVPGQLILNIVHGHFSFLWYTKP
jgi:hypothetical protein